MPTAAGEKVSVLVEIDDQLPLVAPDRAHARLVEIDHVVRAAVGIPPMRLRVRLSAAAAGSAQPNCRFCPAGPSRPERHDCSHSPASNRHCPPFVEVILPRNAGRGQPWHLPEAAVPTKYSTSNSLRRACGNAGRDSERFRWIGTAFRYTWERIKVPTPPTVAR